MTASGGAGRWPRPARSTRACSTVHGPSWPPSASASSAPRRSPSSDSRGPGGRPARGLGHLRPGHAQGRRDDRPTGHRHQAVQAARRVQLDQDLPGASPDDAKIGPGRAGARTPWRPIFENRRQFDRAAEYWRKSHGRVRRPSTATKASGSTRSSATGAGSSRHDPARRARGDRRLPLPQRQEGPLRGPRRSRSTKLLDDVKEYLRSQPAQLDWQQINIGNIGSRLVALNQAAVPGRTVAALGPRPEPLPEHFDGRVTVTTPLQKAGRLPADGADGERQHQPHRRLARRHGHRQEALDEQGVTTSWPTPAPASRSPGPTLEFFGWRMRPGRRARTSSASTSRRSTHRTDEDGQLLVPTPTGRRPGELPVARHRHGRRDGPLRLPRVLATSGDHRPLRPGVRPDQGLHDHRPAGLSARAARCSSSSGSATPSTTSRTPPTSPASRSPSRSTTPRGRRSSTKSLTADDYGGFDGEFELPTDATLGVYQVIDPATTWRRHRSGSRSTRSPSSR